MASKCFGCRKLFQENSPKYSIFERDSEVQKCLIFKVFQITQADLIFENYETSFLCTDCRYLLVQVIVLEKKFAENYISENVTIESIANEIRPDLETTHDIEPADFSLDFDKSSFISSRDNLAQKEENITEEEEVTNNYLNGETEEGHADNYDNITSKANIKDSTDKTVKKEKLAIKENFSDYETAPKPKKKKTSSRQKKRNRKVRVNHHLTLPGGYPNTKEKAPFADPELYSFPSEFCATELYKGRGKSKETILICSLCHNIFALQDRFNLHVRRHIQACGDILNQSFECPKLNCSQTIPNAWKLNVHIKMGHSADIIRNLCFVCFVGIKKEDFLCTHIHRHNADANNRELDFNDYVSDCRLRFDPDSGTNVIGENLVDGIRNFTTKKNCTVKRVDVKKEELEIKEERGKKRKRIQAPEGFGDVNLHALPRNLLVSHDISIVKDAWYQVCALCQKVTKTQVAFDNHIMDEKDRYGEQLETPIDCPKCETKLENKWILTAHYMKMHEKDVKICFKCFETFSTRNLLQKHIIYNHYYYDCENEKDKALCPVCGQGFKSAHMMKMHVASLHDNERSKCHICGAVYKRKYQLIVHNKTVHEQNPENKLICVTCGWSCYHNNQMRQHIERNHSKRIILCKICGKEFRSYMLIHSHIQNHSLSKPYKCSMCQYRSNKQGNVRLHIFKVHKIDKSGSTKYVVKDGDFELEGCKISELGIKSFYTVKEGENPETINRKSRKTKLDTDLEKAAKELVPAELIPAE